MLKTPTHTPTIVNLQDLIEELGGISPERIHFRPAPGKAGVCRRSCRQPAGSRLSPTSTGGRGDEIYAAEKDWGRRRLCRATDRVVAALVWLGLGDRSQAGNTAWFPTAAATQDCRTHVRVAWPLPSAQQRR